MCGNTLPLGDHDPSSLRSLALVQKVIFLSLSIDESQEPDGPAVCPLRDKESKALGGRVKRSNMGVIVPCCGGVWVRSPGLEASCTFL